MRVRICLDASLCGAEGSLMIMAGTAGVFVRYDGETLRGNEEFALKVRPRYGLFAGGKKRKNKESLSIAKAILWLAKTGRMEQLLLHVRIGLADAGETALAAGAVRALAAALFLRFGSGAARELRVEPDFDAGCLMAHARCIFSCQMGDIMLAVLKAAVRKIGKEGFRWKSTPLRA